MIQALLKENSTKNKNQSNLAKGGIAALRVFARWQHKTDDLAAVHVLAGGSTP